jgi:putative component of toxin-antitoxin plasmid stabilization module
MSGKLELISRAGDFVHANQKMAATQGFSCVSKAWYDKTISLSDGIAKLESQKKGREDIAASFGAAKPIINGVGELAIEMGDGRQYIPTQHALKQLLYWAGGIPQTYMNYSVGDMNVKFTRDKQDVETFLVVLRNGWRRADKKKEMLFRTYNDGTLRAVLSERYAIIDNVWYLQVLEKLFQKIGGTEPRLSHWRTDGADTIYGNLLLPDTCRQDTDSDYGGMLNIGNCEIGKRRLSQVPSVFRAICMNGCIWDQNEGEKLNKVHRGQIDYKALIVAIFDNLNSQIPLLADGIKRFLETKELLIPKTQLQNAFAQLAIDNKFTDKVTGMVVNEYIKHEADSHNLFGMINAITRAGQLMGNEDWYAMDLLGGELMNYTRPQFEKFMAKANTLTKEEIAKVFSQAA